MKLLTTKAPQCRITNTFFPAHSLQSTSHLPAILHSETLGFPDHSRFSFPEQSSHHRARTERILDLLFHCRKMDNSRLCLKGQHWTPRKNHLFSTGFPSAFLVVCLTQIPGFWKPVHYRNPEVLWQDFWLVPVAVKPWVVFKWFSPMDVRQHFILLQNGRSTPLVDLR